MFFTKKNIRKSIAPWVLGLGGVLCSATVWAQANWSRTYGGMYEEAGLSVVETPDTGYMLVGLTGSYGNGASDAYLLKTDRYGQLQWFKTYGGANVDVGRKIIPAFGGGYLIAGYSNSATMDYNFWILRINATGDTLWTREVGRADWDRAYSAVGDGYGNYFIAGETYSGNNQYTDGWLVKMNDSGDTLWTKSFSLPGNEYFRDVVKISDTRYAAVGSTVDVITQESDGFVLFFDADGNAIDTVYYDYSFSEHLNCAAVSPADKKMMLGGYYTYDTTNFAKSIQIKVDSTGQVIFQLLAGTADDFGMHILSYGHYQSDIFFFCGRSSYKTSGDHQAVVLKSAFDGYPEWIRNYGTIGPDDGVDAVIKTYDNGFLAVGFTQSYGPGTQALLMFKIASDGSVSNTTTVSVKENTLPEGLAVYPNPATEQVVFKAQNDFSLKLYDANGRALSIGTLPLGNQYTVSVAHLGAGHYFGEMRFADGSIHVEKIYIAR